MAKATPKDVLHLKVTLRGIQPPIGRRLLVPTLITLTQLQDVIQVAFGLDRVFASPKACCGTPSPRPSHARPPKGA